MRHRFVSWVLATAGAVAFGLAMAAAPEPAAAGPSESIHIAFVGDSMADGLWGAMFRRLGKDKCLSDKLKLIRRATNGTGLTRLDQHNWIDEVGSLVDEAAPDLFVGSFGINDRQPIVEADRTRTDFGGAAFETKYQSIAEQLLQRGIAKGSSFLLVGLPVMMDAEANADAKVKNRLFEAAVANVGSPLVSYAQPWTSQPGADEYKPYLPNAHGQLVQVRATDGIHFTTYGYDLVMDAIYPAILARLKQRGRDLAAECQS